MKDITPSTENLIWIDLEMTGLDPDEDRIIEIATIVTTPQLDILAEGPVFAVHQPDELLDQMDAWNVKHHTDSGLVERVKASQVDEEEAQAETLEFLMYYVPPGKSPMCGNSVHQDRRFLVRYMPKLAQYFHYRNLDVSTVKTLASHWAPKVSKGFKKDPAHEALSDIRDSIEEMRYYKENFFKLEEV